MSVIYLHFDNDDRNSRLNRLQKSGAHVVVAEPRWPGFFELAKREKPYAIALDFSQAPSHCPRDGGLPLQGQGDPRRRPLPAPRARRPEGGRREAAPAGHDPHGKRALRKARPDGARSRGAGPPEEGGRRGGQEGGPGRRRSCPRGRRRKRQAARCPRQSRSPPRKPRPPPLRRRRRRRKPAAAKKPQPKKKK